MKHNLEAELEWFKQNKELALKTGFETSFDGPYRRENETVKGNDKSDTQAVCISFAELCADNKSKLRHLVNPESKDVVSKKSFLSNLETKTYKPAPVSATTHNSTSLLAAKQNIPRPVDHTSKARHPVDVDLNSGTTNTSVLSDSAFMDIDVDAIVSEASYPSRNAMMKSSSSCNINHQERPFAPQQHFDREQNKSSKCYEPAAFNPNFNEESRKNSFNKFPPNSFSPHVTQSEESDSVVAELEKQAREVLARLERAKAARCGGDFIESSYSSWAATPAEVQKRAIVPSEDWLGQEVTDRNRYGTQYSSRGGYVDYNQNVDHSNVPASSIMEDKSSYDMRFNENNVGDENSTPLCSCGVPSITLTSRTTANMDRKFFKCAQPKEGGTQCDFFQWADGEPSNIIRGDGGGLLPPDKDFKIENKRMFGHNTFREGQRECIEAALAGRDVFCLMPTGGGKSLVYQLPAWCCPGLAVVFSPLISLIQDQVDALQTMGIRAAYFSASRNELENAAVFDELYGICIGREGGMGSNSQDRSIKLLYLTPEKYKNSPKMRNMLKRLHDAGKLSRYVIDEAHCLSEWGHDFRPDYISLKELKIEFPDTPIMALTATANKTVADDCIRILRLNQPYRHTHSFNRPNIFYTVRKKDRKVMDQIGEIISQRQSQTGIVYCFSKKDTEKVCEDLKKAVPALKNKITFYHADVAPNDKERRQHLWSQGDIKVICATIAFGMGINKPDVRYVIHYSMPKSLTNYYQESGRAGRDGGNSESIVFYSYGDKQRLCALAQKGSEGGGYERNKAAAVARALSNIEEVTSYCMNHMDCRRSLVLRYFGEEFDRGKCRNTCDNCKEQGKWEMRNYSEQGCIVLQVLRGLNKLGDLHDLTLVQLKLLVTNSKDKKITRYREGLEKLGVTGVVKHQVKGNSVVMSKDSCDTLLQTMVVNNFLEEISQATMAGFSAEYVRIGSKATALENGKSELAICLPVGRIMNPSNNNMINEQLSDEQFLMFDIDAAVASNGSGSGSGIQGAANVQGQCSAQQNSRVQKRKGKPSAHSSNKEITVKQRKKQKSQPSFFGRSRHVINLSDSDDSYSNDNFGPFSDIEEEDSGDWISSDIRSRNKGKSQKGALSLQNHEKNSSRREKDTNIIAIENLNPQPDGVQEEDWKLNRKQKAELRDWLYAFRKRYHNYWVVLNNNSVHDIVEQLPLSKKELSQVSGLGENKLRLHGDLIIAATWAYLYKHNLLTHIPAMVRNGCLQKPPVDVKDCPSWKDPHTAEAQEIQERVMESEKNAKKSTLPPSTNHIQTSHWNIGIMPNSAAKSSPYGVTSHTSSPSPASYFQSSQRQESQGQDIGSPESPSLLMHENKNYYKPSTTYPHHR